jgi:hypothetical protein
VARPGVSRLGLALAVALALAPAAAARDAAQEWVGDQLRRWDAYGAKDPEARAQIALALLERARGEPEVRRACARAAQLERWPEWRALAAAVVTPRAALERVQDDVDLGRLLDVNLADPIVEALGYLRFTEAVCAQGDPARRLQALDHPRHPWVVALQQLLTVAEPARRFADDLEAAFPGAHAGRPVLAFSGPDGVRGPSGLAWEAALDGRPGLLDARRLVLLRAPGATVTPVDVAGWARAVIARRWRGVGCGWPDGWTWLAAAIRRGEPLLAARLLWPCPIPRPADDAQRPGSGFRRRGLGPVGSNRFLDDDVPLLRAALQGAGVRPRPLRALPDDGLEAQLEALEVALTTVYGIVDGSRGTLDECEELVARTGWGALPFLGARLGDARPSAVVDSRPSGYEAERGLTQGRLAAHLIGHLLGVWPRRITREWFQAWQLEWLPRGRAWWERHRP